MRTFPSMLSAALVALMGLQAPVFGHGFPDGTFEGRQTHSIGLTPDGTRLLALNTPDGRLSVFDISNAANPAPVLVAEIPVGLEPVSLRARTNDEVWVVNEAGDSISVVSLSRAVVVATLPASDEPADVVFAQGKAFVSCARNNLLRVFDAVTREALPPIPLNGLYPRALATDGTRVFAAFLLSGNGTTVLRAAQAPPPPPPTNPNLPPAPQTALIVAANDPRISYTVLDRDVAEVDVAGHVVTRYFAAAGTNLFDVAIQPGTGNPWVANTEARNLVRFEPALRGHVADHRLTRLDAGSGAATAFDLNAGIDYGVLPNAAAQATALAQPTALVFTSDGAEMWVAAFGSDRVARVNAATGAVTARVELRGAGETSRQMRGPRALVLVEAMQRLYVLNKISNTITVIDTASGSVLTEGPVGSNDPRFASIREGSGFLFDARLSGNGTISCAVCHLDADVDGLAWDLGDPGGEMVTVMGANISAHDPTPRERLMHPMKGPMVTQTLRAMVNGAPFHWRGDRPQLQSFNVTFDKLMAGSQLATADINALASYLQTIMPHPNPNRNRDNSLPATFMGGNPVRGEQVFNLQVNHCVECHSDHAGGLNNLDLASVVGSTQPVKNPFLRTIYQRRFFSPQNGGTSLSGFGMLHDGTGSVLPTVHPYSLDELGQQNFADFADVAAFMLCADTEVPAARGLARTFGAAQVSDAALLADFAMLEAASDAFTLEIAVQGSIAGRRRVFFYRPTTGFYRRERANEPPISRAGLLALLAGDDVLTVQAVPYGRGSRLGGDHDTDAVLDGDEPLPALTASRIGADIRLQWPTSLPGYVLESAEKPGGPWVVVTRPGFTLGASFVIDEPLGAMPARFYRLRRTW